MLALLNSVGLWPVLGSALPLLVALAVKRETKPGVKGASFALLASLAGVAEALVRSLESHTAFEYKTAILSALAAWVVGQTAHSNLWKPSGLAALLQRVGTKAHAVEAKLPASVKSDVASLVAALSAHLQADEASGKHAAEPAAPAASGTVPAVKASVGFALPDPETSIPEEYPVEGDAPYEAPVPE